MFSFHFRLLFLPKSDALKPLPPERLRSAGETRPVSGNAAPCPHPVIACVSLRVTRAARPGDARTALDLTFQ